MEIKIDPKLEKQFLAIIEGTKQDYNMVVEKLINEYVESVKNCVIRIPEENDLTEFRGVTDGMKAVNKIKRIANSKKQINHWILKSFFKCENNGVASKEDMKNYFLHYSGFSSFQSNLNSMKTDLGNNHGHFFDVYGDNVVLFKPVEEYIRKYRSYFE